jgi:uncharacterized membrane protein
MKTTIVKAAVAAAAVLYAASSAAHADQTGMGTQPRHESGMAKIEQGTQDAARGTWQETVKVTRSIVYSPVTAYHIVRGDRPLFTHNNNMRDTDHREGVALTGHRPAWHGNSPPI